MIPQYDKNLLPSKELAEAFLAMMQLMSLRQAWIGDWKPNWENVTEDKFPIISEDNQLSINMLSSVSHPISFPTYEMAKEFLNCFKDLLEQAKILL